MSKAITNLRAFFKPLVKEEASPSNGTPSRKRPRSLIIDSDESDDCSDVKKVATDHKNDGERSEVNGSGVTPKKQSKQSPKVTPKHTPHALTLSTPLTPHTSKALTQDDAVVFVHETLEWLQDDQIRDGKGRLKDHAEYDPKTLMVPSKFLTSQTPAQRQWWDMKRTHFDTILFFKVGKFYELYHMDAVVGVQQCGLVLMKGTLAHCGFPELGFGKFSQMLIQKGYKLARVEQTETPAVMEDRVKNMSKPTKFDRVVKREICSVVTKGTQVPVYQDDDRREAGSVYLTAIKEQGSAYGVCFVDTSIGTFHVGQFEDDDQSTRLRTMFAHHPPAHVIHERGYCSERTASILKQALAGTFKEALTPKSEFWTCDKTLEALSDYLGSEWPSALDSMLDKDSPAKRVCLMEYTLALSALGACLWLLQRACVDTELVSLQHFKVYVPVDLRQPAESAVFTGQRMVLDGITLTNLDVVDTHGRPAGTLLHRIDSTLTAFGKRLLHEWVCAPLCDPAAISACQDAVADLIDHPHLVEEARAVLKSLPDLERKIRKFHMLGHPGDHPDSRALFYDHVIYSKQKIADFITVLKGFERAVSIVTLFRPQLSSLKSPLLRQLVSVEERGFPCLNEQLTRFQTSFNKSEALKAGVIIPAPGVNLSYDQALAGINDTEDKLTVLLSQQKKDLGIKGVSFGTTGRNRYHLEVPEAKCSRVPDTYNLKSQRKGYQRYANAECECLLEELTDWEDKRDIALKDNMTFLFQSFDAHFGVWQSAVECLASLDVFISLARYSASSGMCRPEVVVSEGQPFLQVCKGKHPCVLHTYLGDEFIPNDVTFDEDHPCLVVTGPNMGGKSTLMRQTALLVILAQLGSYVPADKCRLSPVDRLFTRIGASDRITAGESTFFVELKETAAILKHATRHSLILLDELGRGTSTYDGTAIAWAVLRSLAQQIYCRTFFSTHYHSLVEDLQHAPNIRLGHMACLVESVEGEERVTFLYKFVDGTCPHSYGFNVARMAGVPDEVVQLARVKAAQFESTVVNLQSFRELFTSN